MQAKVLQALETAGIFTSGGLVKDKVHTQISLIKANKTNWYPIFRQCEDFQ